MITLNDIKDKVKCILKKPFTPKAGVKEIENVISDIQKTWIGKIYQELPDEQGGGFREVEIGHNTVLLGGLQELAYLLYHIPFQVQIPYFEDNLYATADVDERPQCTFDPQSMPFVQGYNLSNDGVIGADVIPYPRHFNGYDFSKLIPFRVIPLSENDFKVYRNKYYHHRQVTIGGRPYIAYYTKKCNITYQALLDNNQKIPDDPQENLITDRDSRLIAEFPLLIEKEELVEWFRLTQPGGPESTAFSAVMLMIGKAGKWHPKESPEELYDTVMQCRVMSRASCMTVPHGVLNNIRTKYKLMHI